MQRWLVQETADYVEITIGTKVEVGGIYLSWPNGISIEELYLEDQNADTLLYAKYFYAGLDYKALLHAEIEISSLELQNSVLNISVSEKDSLFNFDYIINAFVPQDSIAQKDPAADTSAMDIDIGSIEILNTRFNYNDVVAGLQMSYSIGKLYVETNEFDINENIYYAEEIILKNTLGKIIISKSSPEDTTISEIPHMKVGSANLRVENTDFSFKNKVDKMDFSSNIGELTVSAEPIFLNSQNISLNEIVLNKSKIIFKQGPIEEIPKITEATSPETEPWKIKLDELEINKLSLGYRDANTDRVNNGLDPGNINAAIMHSNITDIYFNDIDSLGAKINALQVKVRSGLAIEEMYADIQLNPQSLIAENVLLRTNNSIIRRDFKMGFSSLENIANEVNSLTLDITINEAVVAWEDIRLLLPDLAADSSMDFLRGKTFYLDSKLSGKISDLNIASFTASTGGVTTMEMKGRIKGLPEINDLWIDLPMLNIKTTAEDLKKLLPTNSIPSNIQLPNKMNLHAKAKGTINNLAANVDLKTDFGNLISTFEIQSSDTTWQNAAYVADIEIPNFELNRLLKDNTFGSFRFNGIVEGKGLTAENIKANITATVSQFEYADYTYSDLLIDGTVEQQKFTGHIEMNDSNLVFSFDGEANLDSNNTAFNFILNLEAADLQHLGLHEDDVRLRGKLSSDIQGNTLNDISGSAELRDFLIIYNGENYPVDSLLFVSIRDSGNTNIEINSTILSGNFEGTINLADIVPTVQDHLHSYLSDDHKYDHTNESQDFKFDLKIHDEDIITDILLPDLKRFVTGDIEGSYNSKMRELNLKLYFPLINYMDLEIDSLYLVSTSNIDHMEFKINVNRFAYDTLSIKNILLNGTLANDSLTSSFSISQDNGVKRFQLAAALTKVNDEIQIKFLDKSILDYEKWNVDQNNIIRLGENTIVDQLRFTKASEYLSLETVPSNKHDYLKVDFGGFEIHNFMDIITTYHPSINRFGLKVPDTSNLDSAGRKIHQSLLKGTINGYLQFPMDTNLSIMADLNIEQLKVSNYTVGNLQLKAKGINSNQQQVLIALSGQNNDLRLSGNIRKASPSSILDLKLDIKQLQLKSLEAFLSNHLVNSEGYLSGEASITSYSNTPNYSGKLTFNNTKFTAKYLGSHYSIPKESITFNNSKISVDDFTIFDSLGNKFVMDGFMNIEKLSNPIFNLTVNSDRFTLLNTTKKNDNDLFYGKIIVTSNMKITGDFKEPIIRSDMKMEEGSDLTFIIPASEPVSLNQNGIVEFVDKDQNLPSLLTKDKSYDTLKTDILGIDLSAFIDIDKETKVKIVIDPITGDYLALKGGGKFKSTIDPAGNISLNGLYTIKEGSYELRLYNLVKRKFDIQEGSNIVWNGDPLSAEMDIKAIYTAKASPIDLLGSQSSNLSREQQGLYRQKLDFEVLLMLNGKLMEPEISFRLDLDENDKGAIGGVVMAKLNEINMNSSELNKQVFALLVLKRFVSQDPFESSAGGGANVARQSVSRIMNQQLNNLTGDNIEGFQIELNIDSYEDYNMEGEQVGRTELGVALSKSLFNERIIVRVNNDFNVEGEAAQTNRSANNFAGDVTVEYLITEDGRYRINVYRDDKYAGLIEGQLIETGVSLIFTKDYQHFRDLFKKPEKENENEKEKKKENEEEKIEE